MRKALLSTAIVALALPASAAAKTGLEFETYPDTSKVGSTIPFTMHIFREPPTRDGRATPVRGIRPLVTFKSESGRVIRVRTGRTDRFGVAHGAVRFTDKGPWMTSYDLERYGIESGDEISEPIHVGIGLTQTTPAAHRAPQPHSAPAASFPWTWVLSLGSIGTALLVFGLRRRGRWGHA